MEKNITFLIIFLFFVTSKLVCEMIDSDAVAIIGPKSVFVSDVVASICNELNIPHIVSYQSTPEIKKNRIHRFTRNIFPDISLLSEGLVDIIKNFEWKRFGIIYDNKESLIRLNNVLQILPAGYKAVTVYKLPERDSIKSFLKSIAKNMEHRIIIDCSIENTIEIIKQGLNVKMMDEYMVSFGYSSLLLFLFCRKTSNQHLFICRVILLRLWMVI